MTPFARYPEANPRSRAGRAIYARQDRRSLASVAGATWIVLMAMLGGR